MTVLLCLTAACTPQQLLEEGPPIGGEGGDDDDMAAFAPPSDPALDILAPESSGPACSRVLDFDADPAGATIDPGEDLSEVYAAWGVHLETWDVEGVVPGLGVAFDSSAPPGTDYDLGTPNERYGGPGLGDGGDTNDEPLHNLLVRAEDPTDADGDGRVDTPDDHRDGALFAWRFDDPMCVVSLDLVDIDTSEKQASVTLLDAADQVLAEAGTLGLGDNSREAMAFDVCGVSGIEVLLPGSGGLDGPALCLEE